MSMPHSREPVNKLYSIAKGLFADVIKGMGFMIVKLSWLIQVGPISHELLNVEEGGRYVGQRDGSVRRICWPVAGSEM